VHLPFGAVDTCRSVTFSRFTQKMVFVPVPSFFSFQPGNSAVPIGWGFHPSSVGQVTGFAGFGRAKIRVVTQALFLTTPTFCSIPAVWVVGWNSISPHTSRVCSVSGGSFRSGATLPSILAVTFPPGANAHLAMRQSKAPPNSAPDLVQVKPDAGQAEEDVVKRGVESEAPGGGMIFMLIAPSQGVLPQVTSNS